MSNTRRLKWTADEISADNAVAALTQLWDAAEAESTRLVLTRRLAADLAAAGWPEDKAAQVVLGAAGLDDKFFLELARQFRTPAP